jgi:hypothetical protein
MKNFTLFVLLFLALTSFKAWNQTHGNIENDLYKSYKKIDFWLHNNNVYAYDSLMAANSVFARKLMFYTSRYPFTITQKFSSFQKDHLDIYNSPLDIYTSSDNLFRIYSWDTWEGGTMHHFENVFQYRSGAKTVSILDTAKTGDDYTPSYENMYTFKTKLKTYYLCTFSGTYSTKDASQGIQIFDIENGKLNNDVKLFKTKSGLRSQISSYFDSLSEVDWKVRPEIYFNPYKKTINFPQIDEDNKMMHKYIVYKFTGQYFERVKN